jgi:amidohydrolase
VSSRIWAFLAVGLFALMGTLSAPVSARDSAPGSELDSEVEKEIDGWVSTFKKLHASPELSYQEKETSAFVAGRLRELGFDVTERVGDYGVEDRTGLSYGSQATGLNDSGEEVATMHACGHDLHMTSFLGTAQMLSGMKDDWNGTLVMIGQPAEERGSGAGAMLNDGLYRRFPKPDYALALHTSAAMPAGTVGVRKGYALANVDSVDILVRGKGGHGAWPHMTKDPVTLAAQIVVNLQTIVSRQIPPLESAVVTVGSIHGGTKHNIIPDEVRLQLTVRSYLPEVRDHLLEAIRQVAEGTARSQGWPDDLLPVVTHNEEEYTPSTYNDPDLLDRMAAVFVTRLGQENVREVDPTMGGEDFSRFALDGEIPIGIFWLGAVEPARVEAAEREGRKLPSLHSAELVVDPEPSIRTGVTAMTAIVLDLMGD